MWRKKGQRHGSLAGQGDDATRGRSEVGNVRDPDTTSGDYVGVFQRHPDHRVPGAPTGRVQVMPELFNHKRMPKVYAIF